ncbi:hypothetical protein TNIN_461351 [Trichonephila inaurata madagascariensis]|uniref:Uncharacterized protein n=1 Tax=Trichonephila inaurata madagascariensis TaxID=2747483 RepID=A0A8X7CEY3_9ARAC|nr:hypothetical protein TNIN_461351 [Trichonephila inaurata madagascariensis]
MDIGGDAYPRNSRSPRNMQRRMNAVSSHLRRNRIRLSNRTVFDSYRGSEEAMHDERYSRLWDRFQLSLTQENLEDVYRRKIRKLKKKLKMYNALLASVNPSIAERVSKMNNKCSGKKKILKPGKSMTEDQPLKRINWDLIMENKMKINLNKMLSKI